MSSFSLLPTVSVGSEMAGMKSFSHPKIIFAKKSTYPFEFTNFAALKVLQYAYSK
jgi:hypothetical protein